MGFLKKLVKPLAIAGGIVAAPFTGGASLAISAGVYGADKAKKLQREAEAAASAENQRMIDAQNALAAEARMSGLTSAQNPFTGAEHLQPAFDWKPIAIVGGGLLALFFFARRI